MLDWCTHMVSICDTDHPPEIILTGGIRFGMFDFECMLTYSTVHIYIRYANDAQKA